MDIFLCILAGIWYLWCFALALSMSEEESYHKWL